MKPRKFRRMILSGHRWTVMREDRGHASPDRSLKRYMHMRRFLGPLTGSVYQPNHGKHPEQKPKIKK